MNILLGRISALSLRARVFLVVFAVLACGTFVFFAIGRRASNQAYGQQGADRAEARAAQVAALTRDGDADGLKDWEEAIFRTDPHNPDSDADNTPDGEEVQHNRDPLVPGPDDILATSTPQFVDFEDMPPGGVNLTSRLAQALGQQVIAQRLINPAQPINPQEIGARIADSIPAYAPAQSPLTLRDLKINKDDGAAAIKAWQAAFEKILRDTFGGRTEMEPMIMLQALQKDDYHALAALDPVLIAHDAGAARMKILLVPAPFAQYQLDALQTILQLRDLIQRFRNAADDPITAFAAIEPYFDATERIHTAAGNIHDKLVARHITP